MKKLIHLILTFLFASFAVLNAAEERPTQLYGQLVQEMLFDKMDELINALRR